MVDSVRGVLRVRKWPKKRGPPKSAKQAFWVDWFIQANRLAKYADGMSLARAIEMTKDSGLYPRDVLLMAMRGRLYNWVDQDGWRWYSVAAIGDISESLDVLGQTVGDILVRAVDRWRPPPAGSVGQVLTHAGPAAPPVWAPSTGVGGFVGGALVRKTANQSIPNIAWTVLTWNAETYDTNALHDNAVNNSRLTVPPGITWGRLNASVHWDNNSTGYRVMRFKKNGSAAFAGNPAQRGLAITFCDTSLPSAVLPLVAPDYLEVEVFQSSGAPLNILAFDQTSFSLELL